MIDADELAAWLQLLETPLLGRESARRLLGAFGSPQAVLAASAAARRTVVAPSKADALLNPPDSLPALLAATLDWLVAGGSDVPRAVVAIGDPRYPKALLDTADPPLLLYAQGRLELLHSPRALAIVGSRNPTPQGAENARAFAEHLSRAGLTIVSGMALGVDAAAHAGALDGGSGTIAVVGTGLDIVYPRRNHSLARRIAVEGLMLSEFSIGTPSMAPNFPRRNRIIAGLTSGTLVVEAALQSGSLITARFANEAGREVFAIPGSIHSPQSRGCHALIRQGAKLVETAQDILEELRLPAGLAGAAPIAPIATAVASGSDPLLVALGFDPVTLDALCARSEMSASEVSARLLEMEFDGRVTRLPGQLFQRTGRS